eukprot:TRINITY_DN17600_c0_g1_i1.p1 TRINITY_DN17600_c0_g1~~TRINITY_DN17600_c0_g1_i1.p1  ORF type:complete len:436 (+),score=22.24 TRINITY_DN17600_c0_g1_i1:69-1376(+)
MCASRILLLLSLVAVALSQVSRTPKGAYGSQHHETQVEQPEQIHISWPGIAGQMAVTWVTPGNTTDPGSYVYYGDSPGNLSLSTSGSYHRYTAGGWNNTIHTVVLTGLTPSSTYFYRCASFSREDADNGLSPTFSFQAAPAPDDFPLPLNVAVYGDMGTQWGSNQTVTYMTDRVTDGDVDFLLHVGDIAYDEGDEFVWDTFFRDIEPYAARIPYMTCPGNEDHWYNFTSYLNRFYMPGQQPTAPLCPTYYSIDYSMLHVVSYDTEMDFYPGSEQYAWLQQDLEWANAPVNRTLRPWVVMIGHRPLYCSTNDYYDCGMWGPEKRKVLEPLMAQYSVDIYLCGHVHSYERTYPVLNGTVQSYNYNNPGAPVHVTVGTAGAGLTGHWSTKPAWSVRRISTYGVANMRVVNETTLEWSFAVDLNGTIADSFTLYKDITR